MSVYIRDQASSVFTLSSDSLFKFQPNQKISVDVNDVNVELVASLLQESPTNLQASRLAYDCSFVALVQPLGLISFDAGKYPLRGSVKLSSSEASTPLKPQAVSRLSSPGTAQSPSRTKGNIVSQLLTAFLHESTLANNVAEVPYSFSVGDFQKYLPSSLETAVLNFPKTCDTIELSVNQDLLGWRVCLKEQQLDLLSKEPKQTVHFSVTDLGSQHALSPAAMVVKPVLHAVSGALTGDDILLVSSPDQVNILTKLAGIEPNQVMSMGRNPQQTASPSAKPKKRGISTLNQDCFSISFGQFPTVAFCPNFVFVTLSNYDKVSGVSFSFYSGVIDFLL